MTRMIYTPRRLARNTPRRLERKPAKYALWVVCLAALPLAACLGVTVLLNICGG
jgi:hypothetical protein